MWKFRPSLSICFYSLCSVVGLRSFGQRAQGTTLFFMAMVPSVCCLLCSPYLAMGIGGGRVWDVFQKGMRLERVCISGMHNLSSAPG